MTFRIFISTLSNNSNYQIESSINHLSSMDEKYSPYSAKFTICSCICFCFHLAAVCVCVCVDFQAFSFLSCTTCIQLINTLAVSINARVLPHYLHFFYSSFAFDCYYSVRKCFLFVHCCILPKNLLSLMRALNKRILCCAVHAIGAYIFNGIQ